MAVDLHDCKDIVSPWLRCLQWLLLYTFVLATEQKAGVNESSRLASDIGDTGTPSCVNSHAIIAQTWDFFFVALDAFQFSVDDEA